MIRLGLCCKFLEEDIRFRTTTVTYLKKHTQKGEDPLLYINDIIKDNVQNLLLAIDFCIENKIGCFRIGSDFFPAYTHPDIKYLLEQLPEGELILKEMQSIGQKAFNNDIRLVFHPDQFVVLSSPSKDVVEKSIADLEYHALMAEILGADVINIHGGGGYGDKLAALNRFISNFSYLSDRVKSRLTVENDDKTYSPHEILYICNKINIPFVYDAHHHRCLKDTLSIEEATKAALQTWKKEPLFHISSPKEGWDGPKPNRHHDFIDSKDVPQCWAQIPKLTIEVEAKSKELAVLKLKKDLLEKNWPIF